MKSIKRCLVWLCLGVFLGVMPALAQENINDLGSWEGRHITTGLGSSTFSADVMRPVFEAIAESTPELSLAQVEAAYTEIANTDFDSFSVVGRLVTFDTASGPVTCRYSYSSSEPLANLDAEGDWHLFEAGPACTNYRYLALGLPQANELSSGFQFRYGDESLEALIQDEYNRAWYPAAYPKNTPIADILANYTENAAVLGAALAQRGVEAAAPAPNTDDVKGTRLLVSDAVSTNVHMLDAASGEVIASFATAGQAGRVYASPNGRFGFVVHRDEDRVSLVHSGLTTVDHLDHVDLVQGSPYVAATMNVGREPTHFFAHDNDVAFFNDEDGTVSLLDQRLLGLSLDYAQVTVAQPDHGAPAVHGDYVLSGYYDLGRVDIYRRSGEQVTTIEDCPGLHGKGMAGDLIVYGCEDGVLLIRVTGDNFEDTKLANPANTPEDVRVGTVAAHEDSEVMIGNFGAGIVIINPTTGTLSPVELGTNPLQMAFADAETLVVLGDDGQLYLLEPDSGETLSSIQVMDAPDLEAEGVVRPTLIVRGDFVYVSDPSTQQLHEVALADLSLRRSMALDFTPYSLAAFSIPGATIHD